MTKVALINPGKNIRYSTSEPLHLGFLASYLEKNGIEVAIIDELAGQNIQHELERYKPDIVGITATTSLIDEAYEISAYCKGKGLLTVLGGVHVSIFPEEAIKHADIVVVGEGEKAFVDIVKNNIRSGIINGSIIENLDDIPPPARHLMQMDYYMSSADRFPESYLYFVPPKTKVASILTSRGCPYSCIYCHNTWRGTPFRFNSADRVIQEIKQLIFNYGVKAIFFIEDNLFANKKRLKEICEKIRQEKLDFIWAGNARVNNIDKESLKLAKEAGCRQITFGLESGSQRILDVLKKNITLDQSRKAIAMCKELGIIINGTFMIGNQTETLEDIEATKEFIKENKIDRPGISITTPFPGTELWNWCKKEGLIPDKYKWSDFTLDKISFLACKTLTAEQIMGKYYELTDIAYENAPIKMGNVFSNPGSFFAKLLLYVRQPGRWVKLIKRIRF